MNKSSKGMLFGAMALIAGLVSAGMGQPDAAPWSQKGSYVAARKIAATNTVAGVILPADSKRPDAICFNNTSSTLWIGSITLTATELRDNGFPILSSATFKLDGTMSGGVIGICDGSSCDVRCLDGKVQ